MNRFIKCLAVLLLLTNLSFSQTLSFFEENRDNYKMIDSTDIDPYSFFPMQEGNFWQWAQLDRIFLDVKVAKDSLLENGNKLIYISYNGSNPYEPTWLIDTTFNVFYWSSDPRGQSFEYKLNAILDEVWWVFRADFDSLQGGYKKVVGIYEGEFLGQSTVYKEIHFFTRELIGDEYIDIFRKKEVLASGLGVILRNYDDYWEPPEYVRGAVINGDTLGLLVSVEQDLFTENPEKFTLSQNYPNPFNSETTIHYSLPKSSGVRLEIFNILGENVKTKNLGYQNQGAYKVHLNFTELPAGVYIYSLLTDYAISSKKMTYLK